MPEIRGWQWSAIPGPTPHGENPSLTEPV
jgi:hypothetical protein